MTLAIVVLYVLCSLLTLAVLTLAWYCNYLAERHNALNDALVAYAEGVTKVFASLRIVTIREKEPADTVFRVEAPKGIQ